MTGKQAQRELARLCAYFEEKNLNEEQVRQWMKALMSLPYETGRAAIDAVIAKWEYPRFPTVAYMLKRAKEVHYEGTPNAAAYSQNDDDRAWWQTEEGEWMLFCDDRIKSLTDGEYWRYVTESAFRRQKIREWEREWTGGDKLGEKRAAKRQTG